MDYFSFFTIEDNMHSRKMCSLYKVQFSNWSQSCEFPKTAVLKVVCKNNNRYCKSELRNLVFASSLHTGFLEVYKFFEDSLNIYIFMERCANDSLTNYILQNRNSMWDNLQLLYRMKEITKSLLKLSRHRISHRDIKLDNIFITAEGKIKLGDLGLAKELDENDMRHSHIGTHSYRSPQSINGEDIDPFKDDIWATGVTFYLLSEEQLSNVPRLNKLTQQEINMIISRLKVTGEIKEIIQGCLEIRCDKRINIEGLYAKIKDAIERNAEDLNPAQGKEQYYEAISYRYQLNFPEFPNKNNLRTLGVPNQCVICGAVNQLICYRFVHKVHIDCLLSHFNLSFDCNLCTFENHQRIAVNQVIDSITGNLINYRSCQMIDQGANCSTNHTYLVLNKNFASQMFECATSNKIFCSLCNQLSTKIHLHCIGLKKYFENFTSQVILHSSPCSEIYLQNYSRWNFLRECKNPDERLLENYVVKKIALDTVDSISVFIYSIASFISEYIIKLHYWYVKNDKLLLILEYAKGKTLLEEIRYRSMNNLNFDKNELVKMIKVLSNSKIAFHSKQIYHRDINAENIYITEENEYKLGGFLKATMNKSRSFDLEKNDVGDICNVIKQMMCCKTETPTLSEDHTLNRFLQLCINYSFVTNFKAELSLILQQDS